jgi:cell division protein ZipA
MGLELGMREWILLAGVALVVVILLDAIRRAIKQRAENERLMRAKKSARQEPHADFDWLKELPNGGARVVYRGDGEISSEAEENESSGTSVDSEMIPDKPQPVREQTANDDEGLIAISAAAETPEKPSDSPHGSDASQSSIHSGEPSVTSISTSPAPSGQTVDWLESLDTEEEAPEEAPALIDDKPPEHVLLIHLKADDDKPYQGDTLLQLLLACDLRFGDLGFFHRHEQSGGRGPIQFSVANLLKPGVFEIDSMSTLQTAGVVFFMRVPGPKDLLTAYEAMLETARAVVQHLGGSLLDHSHSVLTKQAIEHDKTLLREYARKQLLQKRS